MKLAQITPEWLTTILRLAGASERTKVVGLRVEPLPAGASFNAQLARLFIEYDRPDDHAPRTLMAKLPTVDESLHQNAAVFRPGRKENWFYRRGAARAPLHTPACIYNAVDEASGESILLLEDLAPARSGERIRGGTPEELELALRSAARLHAAWWQVDLAQEPELAGLMDNPAETQALVERLYRRGWPRFAEGTAGLDLPRELYRVGEQLLGNVARAEALLDASPHTLIHGDFRLENLLFGARQGQPVCWVIDWEDVTVWPGVFDAAWLLGGGLREDDAAHEEPLLRAYHGELAAAGVANYSWETCYLDYRKAMLSAVVQGILTVARLGEAARAPGGLGWTLARRFGAACERLRLADLL